ncbi:ZPR1 zinc-finger domain-containing protein [Suillus placidus]|uniref:ZPR1 zinc-finger domain-containing protein n=1 Tax=Suillus placidus TaxID=48579 RepID=A0A9P7D426_9AGAM|nr:ZPR1 zinc-finger domain-containing protein [Suillus placidus]
MLTSIPFFREVIVMSFRCEHCGHSNNEIKSAGKIRPEGTMYTVKVLNRGDLNRQFIRSEACAINIPECQLVLPPSRGQLTTVEGLLGDIVADLNVQQPLRRIQEDPVAHAITITLDDPSGNSFLEFVGSMSDLKWNMRTYERSLGQLGLAPPAEDKEADADTLIISTNCDDCAYRDNEIKSGTAISELGKRITLKVEDIDDLDRDILKSDTSSLSIPEIDLVLHPGTLGGRFTTLEGILDQVYEELTEKVFNTGDSGVADNAETRIPFTLILDDPLANSHVQNLYAPHPDPNLEVVAYERTWQQNEDLGLNDTNMESYSGDDTKDEVIAVKYCLVGLGKLVWTVYSTDRAT